MPTSQPKKPKLMDIKTSNMKIGSNELHAETRIVKKPGVDPFPQKFQVKSEKLPEQKIQKESVNLEGERDKVLNHAKEIRDTIFDEDGNLKVSTTQAEKLVKSIYQSDEDGISKEILSDDRLKQVYEETVKLDKKQVSPMIQCFFPDSFEKTLNLLTTPDYISETAKHTDDLENYLKNFYNLNTKRVDLFTFKVEGDPYTIKQDSDYNKNILDKILNDERNYFPCDLLVYHANLDEADRDSIYMSRGRSIRLEPTMHSFMSSIKKYLSTNETKDNCRSSPNYSSNMTQYIVDSLFELINKEPLIQVNEANLKEYDANEKKIWELSRKGNNIYGKERNKIINELNDLLHKNKQLTQKFDQFSDKERKSIKEAVDPIVSKNINRNGLINGIQKQVFAKKVYGSKNISPEIKEKLIAFSKISDENMSQDIFNVGLNTIYNTGIIPTFLGIKKDDMGTRSGFSGNDFVKSIRKFTSKVHQTYNIKSQSLNTNVYLSNNPLNFITSSPTKTSPNCQSIMNENGNKIELNGMNTVLLNATNTNQTKNFLAYTLDNNGERQANVEFVHISDKEPLAPTEYDDFNQNKPKIYGNSALHKGIMEKFCAKESKNQPLITKSSQIENELVNLHDPQPYINKFVNTIGDTKIFREKVLQQLDEVFPKQSVSEDVRKKMLDTVPNSVIRDYLINTDKFKTLAYDSPLFVMIKGGIVGKFQDFMKKIISQPSKRDINQ